MKVAAHPPRMYPTTNKVVAALNILTVCLQGMFSLFFSLRICTARNMAISQ